MKIAARVFLLIATLAVTACGFQLRGEVDLPPSLKRIHLAVSDPLSPLQRDLELALKRAGAELAATPTDAAQLRIPLNQLTVEPLTVSTAARVQEYLVRYRIELEIVDAAGTVLVAKAPIELTRDYSYDETQALGAAAEQELIGKELQREMVQHVLRRLETAAAL
jgi:LPS-assembly lipoprotein